MANDSLGRGLCDPRLDAVLVLEDDEPGQSRVSGNLAIQVFGASANEVAELRESVARISLALLRTQGSVTQPVSFDMFVTRRLFERSPHSTEEPHHVERCDL